MPLPSTGTLSLSQIQTEFGGTNPISLSEYYNSASGYAYNISGIPTSGAISVSVFYGKSKVTAPLALTSFSTSYPAYGQIRITFANGSDGGSAITGYKYNINGGGFTNFSGSPLNITGLAYKTSYTIGLLAVNSLGDGAISYIGATTTGPDPPAAPTITSLAAGPSSGKIYIYFTQGSNGGSAITNYQAKTWLTSQAESGDNLYFNTNQTTSPLLISTAPNTLAYWRIRAVNIVGVSPGSNALSGRSA